MAIVDLKYILAESLFEESSDETKTPAMSGFGQVFSFRLFDERRVHVSPFGLNSIFPSSTFS
jgi:hypothetical protein